MLLLMLVVRLESWLPLLASDGHSPAFFSSMVLCLIHILTVQKISVMFQLCFIGSTPTYFDSLLRISFTVLNQSLLFLSKQIISFLIIFIAFPHFLCILQTARIHVMSHANDLILLGIQFIASSSDDFNLTVNATVSLPSFCPSCCFLLWFSISYVIKALLVEGSARQVSKVFFWVLLYAIFIGTFFL